MAYKILTKNGIDNSNIDGARGEYFNSGMRDGIVQGALNEGLFTATASNIISLDTCELRIAGHRIVIDEPVYHTFTNAPSSDTRYAFVAQIVVDDNQNVEFSLFVQAANTPLIQNDLYKNITGAGTYQIEIGRFTLLTSLVIEDAVRTIDVITGGTGKGGGSTINIGTVTTQTLDSDVDAEVDVSERYEEDEGKEYLDFTFGIPKAEVNVDTELSTTSENAVQNKAITNAIIRRDVAQTLTDTEKQQAQKNITHTATQNYAASGVQVGWYQVANLKTNGNYDVKIKQAYNYYFPEAIHLSISINNRLSTVEPFASITQLSGVNPGAFSLSKIRVRQGTDEGTTFLDVYNPYRSWNTTWVDITSDSQDVVVEPNNPFEFIGTEDNPSGYKISSLDLVTGFNTSSLSVNNEEWQKIDFLTLDSGVGPISAVADRGRNYLRNSMVETSGVVISTSGWYRVAQLTDYMSGKVDICKQYNYGLSQVISIDFGLAYRVDAGSSYLKVTTTSKFNAIHCIDQVRIAQYVNDPTSYPYLEVHITAVSGQNNTYWSIFKDISAADGTVLTSNFQMLAFEPVSGTPIATKVIDVKGETNVSNLNVNNTVTFSGTVSDLNTISQPVNSVVTYSFGGGCAHAPKTDSGMVTQMQASTAFCTQLVIANDADASTWRRSYRDGTWQEWKQILNTKKDDILIYDMDSEDENVNRGFTSGMKGTNYIQLDFSQYKSIRIYARLYTSNCVQEIPVKNRKVAQTAMVVTGSNPIIISSLNILFTIEPLLNRLQVGAYGKYTFSSAEGTFTLESGASNDNFYVYRIEGIV